MYGYDGRAKHVAKSKRDFWLAQRSFQCAGFLKTPNSWCVGWNVTKIY